MQELVEVREVRTNAVIERQSSAVIAADVLEQAKTQRELLRRYVSGQMVEGTDYGVIPGTQKKTLLKPGAEKLTELFRCTPKFTRTKSVEDWEKSLFHYEFACEIISRDTDIVLAVGVGSCNSRESRYRWRNGERLCPACGKATIIKGKAEYGGGWMCFAKKGGCGAKFGDHDKSITDQVVGRVENPDVCDQVNTILKMAKKRALVDATLSLARCSDIFTQDLEDGDDEPERTPPAQPQPQSQSPAPTIQPRQGGLPVQIETELRNALHNRGLAWNAPGMSERVSQIIGRPVGKTDHMSTLTEDEARMLIERIKSGKKEAA